MDDKLPFFEKPLGRELLRPTRIYVSPVLHLLEKYKILGIAHITGGGIVENIPRILPKEISVRIDQQSWPTPSIFNFIQEEGEISDGEMYQTFNMGIGMVLIVSPNDASKVMDELKMLEYNSYLIGKVIKRE